MAFAYIGRSIGCGTQWTRSLAVKFPFYSVITDAWGTNALLSTEYATTVLRVHCVSTIITPGTYWPSLQLWVKAWASLRLAPLGCRVELAARALSPHPRSASSPPGYNGTILVTDCSLHFICCNASQLSRFDQEVDPAVENVYKYDYAG